MIAWFYPLDYDIEYLTKYGNVLQHIQVADKNWVIVTAFVKVGFSNKQTITYYLLHSDSLFKVL